MANEKNLTPFKPGQSGNPKGRPKGRKNLSTILREFEQEDYDWTVIPTINDELREQFEAMGAPFRVIALIALGQAIKGDKDAREWITRTAYGDKLDINVTERRAQEPVIISNIKPRHAQTEPEAKTEESH